MKRKKLPELDADERLCPRCSGWGNWVEKDSLCFRCNGSGKIKKADFKATAS